MSHPRATLVAMLMLWTTAASAQTRGPVSQPATQNSPATVSDVSALMAAAQYADALRAINRLLPGARGGGTGQDRHELLMMRAEAQLHLKNNDAAILTLGDLARESQEAADVKGQNEAIALTALIQHSSNSMYFSRTPPDKTGIGILDPESRKRAYSALLSDELMDLRAKEALAKSNKTLAPLVDIAHEFGLVVAIERTASGDVKQTSSMAKELSKWATTQIDDVLDDQDARITRIATDVGRRSGTGSSRSVRRGLDPDQTQTLTEIREQCQQIPALTQELNKAFGSADAIGGSVRAKAIADRASTILDGGYAPPVKRPARSGR